MHDLKPGTVIVCGGCCRGVPLDRWSDHRQTCWRLAEQLALSEELEPDAALVTMSEDLRQGKGARVKLPVTTCPTCRSGPGELCVKRDGGAMRTLHQKRRVLEEERSIDGEGLITS